VTDGLQISGALTWLLATVIVRAGALIAGPILPALFLERAVSSRHGAPAQPVTTWP
jgi:hypothetical protein